jgi:hypothetical protein
MKMVVVDLDKDGRSDVVVAGKSGLYVFYHKGFAPAPKVPNRLLLEETYPSWVPWSGK